jgi:hypothetical protein
LQIDPDSRNAGQVQSSPDSCHWHYHTFITMFPLLCIRGDGSLTVSTHLSLQNRLLAINYINDGGDDELYIAHRYELYPSKLSLWAITKYFSSSSCCSCLLVISLSAAFMRRSWRLAQWGGSEKICLDIKWHGVQAICSSCAKLDEPSHSRHFMRGPWVYGLQPIRLMLCILKLNRHISLSSRLSGGCAGSGESGSIVFFPSSCLGKTQKRWIGPWL